jgi:hypothetical protein
MSNDDNPVIRAARTSQQDYATFVTMRKIGTLLRVSSHVVGRKLKEIGLRDADGEPTQEARTNGLTTSVIVDGRFVLNLWHQHKTLAVLRPLIDQHE